MSVTVVTRQRARPGDEAALIEAVVRSGEAARGGRAAGRLFQSVEDPELFFGITEEEPREPAGTGAGAAPAGDVAAGTSERQVYEQISAEERAGQAGAATGGAVVELPPAASGAALAFSEQVAQQMCAAAGVVRVGIYRDVDNHDRFLALCDWESEAARQRFYAELLPRYVASVREHGGKLEVFVERTRADVERYPRAGDAPRPAEQPGLTPTD